jgi:calcium-dependent protein kinase
MSEFILGDYIFSRKRIGKGAFSTIYKGTHKFNGNTYAIKEICFDNLEKIRENIRREFTLMKALNHPNIIKLHDVFFDNLNKNVYIVFV